MPLATPSLAYKGPRGDPGPSLHAGTAVPGSGYGSEGDFYLVSGGSVYAKSSGSWSYTGVSLQGAQGPAGQAGGATLQDVYPVGSVYIATVSTSPATLFGFGTWARLGEGRTLISQSSGDADFDTAKETGGAKTHTLTEAEIPAHTHVQDAHTHVQNAHSHNIGHVRSATTGAATTQIARTSDTSSTLGADVSTDNATAVNQNATAVNQSTGGGGAHNNMPPYIVVYIWERTA